MTKEKLLSIIQVKLYENDIKNGRSLFDSTANWDEIPFWLRLRYRTKAEEVLEIIKDIIRKEK